MCLHDRIWEIPKTHGKLEGLKPTQKYQGTSIDALLLKYQRSIEFDCRLQDINNLISQAIEKYLLFFKILWGRHKFEWN